MNKLQEVEQIAKAGAETAILPFFIARDAPGYVADVGRFAVGQFHDFFDNRPDIVESRIATMPLNEVKIAAQQLDIAESRLDFPAAPITVAEVAANHRGRNVQKAMRRMAFSRLAWSVLYAESNPVVPPEVTDKTVAMATEQGLDPERLDDDEFAEIDKHRLSRVLEQRQGYRPAFSARQLVRAFFRS